MSVTVTYYCDDCDERVVRPIDEPHALATPAGWVFWEHDGKSHHACQKCAKSRRKIGWIA